MADAAPNPGVSPPDPDPATTGEGVDTAASQIPPPTTTIPPAIGGGGLAIAGEPDPALVQALAEQIVASNGGEGSIAPGTVAPGTVGLAPSQTDLQARYAGQNETMGLLVALGVMAVLIVAGPIYCCMKKRKKTQQKQKKVLSEVKDSFQLPNFSTKDSVKGGSSVLTMPSIAEVKKKEEKKSGLSPEKEKKKNLLMAHFEDQGTKMTVGQKHIKKNDKGTASQSSKNIDSGNSIATDGMSTSARNLLSKSLPGNVSGFFHKKEAGMLELEGSGDIEARRVGDSDKKKVPNFCSICLSSYEPGDKVVWSTNSKCPHVFHEECIIENLTDQKDNATLCPCCFKNFC